MKYVNSDDLFEHVPEIILLFGSSMSEHKFIAIACKVMLGASAIGSRG